MNRNAGLAFGLIVAVTIASVPLWANQGWVFIAGVVLIEALFCLSWNLLFGFAGLATFGHAAFFAMGAYLVGLGLTAYPYVPFPILLMAGVLLGAVAALSVGLIALRRTGGMQLAILTLAMSEVLYIVINNTHALGGADGLAGIPRPSIGSISLRTGAAYYWFLFVVCGSTALAMWWLVHSRFGRILRCIKQDPERAAFIGVNVHSYRLAAFVVSGSVAALAGGLSAPWTQIVAPNAGHWMHSVQAILNSLMGGAGFFWGPALGTVIFAGIDYITRTFAGVSEVVIGGILLLVVLAFPGGILGALSNIKWRRAARKDDVATSAKEVREPAE
jgi:ABC-type branched-subunit amino acid transport system permease subunit